MTSAMSQAERDDLNQQYMPRISVPDAETYLEKAAARSAEARDRLHCLIDVPYGETTGQTVDIFPAENPDAPVHVFIHGGYWRALDKSVYSEMAEPLVAAGATVILSNYDLCPAVTVTEIVRQTRRCLAWVYGNARAYNGDRDRIHISGHSAGGHLVGMMIATDWQQEAGLPNDLIKTAAPLSGLFDLTRHRDTDVQADVNLTVEETRTLSPILLPPVARGPVLVAVGGGEPDLFQWQSLAYTAHLRFNRIKAEFMPLGTDHHFNVTDRLAHPDDPLTRALIAQMEL